MSMKKKIIIFLLLTSIILIASIFSFYFLKTDRTYGDENIHSWQIQQFLSGNFKHHPNLTTLPGYHYLMYFFSKVFGITSISGMRYITFSFGILAFLFFYFSAKKISPDNAHMKTLQFFFLPILFQYSFLVYTDVTSLFFVLAAFFFAIKKHNNISFIFIFASIFMRQTNIIWLLFIFIAIYFINYGYAFDKTKIVQHCKKNILYIAGITAFIAFIFFNKGFALGDKEMHPWFSFHLGNIYIILIAFFFLFLPLNIYNFSKIFSFINPVRKRLSNGVKKKPIILGVLFIFFLVYIFTSTYSHYYNQEKYVFYIKNVLLVFLNKYTIMKMLFFLLIAYSILSLAVTKLHEKWQYLIYPATILLLLPSSLIEHRYYIIPFSLFILFKQKQSRGRGIEYSQIVIFIIVSLGIMYGLSQEKFFF